MTRLAVLFHHVGPYHAARVRAATALAPAGAKLVCVELAGRTTEYAWAPTAADGFEKVTVVPDGDSNDLPRGQLAARVAAALDVLDPTALAVAGYADPGMLAATRWGVRRGRSLVLMSDSQYHDEPRSRWKEWVKRQVVGCFGAGFVAGTTHADYLRRLGMPAERIFTGYDVVDNAHFAAGAEAARNDDFRTRAALGLPDRYFLAVSRFVPKKNLGVVIDAYAAYHRASDGNPWGLVLVGDGPLRGDLEVRVSSHGLGTAVHFAGFRQVEALPAYYGLASAFVKASTTEQWGLVVNEAMAAGLPVLVSRACGCAPDMVRDSETGYTFDPADATELAGLFAKVSSDEAATAAMGAASRREIVAWSPARFAESLWAAAAAASVTRRRFRGVVLSAMIRR